MGAFRHVLLPTPYSLLPVPYSLFPTPYSLFPIPYSLLGAFPIRLRFDSGWRSSFDDLLNVALKGQTEPFRLAGKL